MEQQHVIRLAEAYSREFEKRYNDKNNAPELLPSYLSTIQSNTLFGRNSHSCEKIYLPWFMSISAFNL